ncbi:hypothetical protein [Streptomyces ferrugineus]|nr:hypothetical protein [Streptomyces ferrugineus]
MQKSRFAGFGYCDDETFAVCLACGGIIDILVTRFAPTAPTRP